MCADAQIPPKSSATIPYSVSAEKQARRYFVSGLVQGVGFRYFTQDAAERLHLAGYVRNLRDGRVEAYAIGTEEQLLRFLAALKKGPRGAMVHGVVEKTAAADEQYAKEFSITHDEW
jgi:acylphosphatase